ncbi:helix-turn-helix transcriptional regulator [Streptomyces sp. NPDC007369]|uniref:helix-turn-helix domain-containing protein n=1 Tax=Streptomyces sp. NPDC007369 TaxID=3154589 RepID=UPI0033FBA47C
MTQTRFDDGDEDDVPEWADRVMADVAREVRRRRKEMKWTAQKLADRCEEIGYPIPRNVIANMESGRRVVLPLVEVMVLAKALNTHPIHLIYPVGYVEEVQKLPLTSLVDPGEAMCWFADLDQTFTAGPANHSMLHDHLAHRAALAEALNALKGEARQREVAAKVADDTERAQVLRAQADFAEQAARAKYQLRNVRRKIYTKGGFLPDLPNTLTDVDPDEGYERKTV